LVQKLVRRQEGALERDGIARFFSRSKFSDGVDDRIEIIKGAQVG
jgi:hypothetical protein